MRGGLTEPIRYMPASEMQPEAGPVAMYRAVYPHHHVVWNVGRQCWEVVERHPLTGYEGRVALLRGDDGRYLPFDYVWVKRRLLDRLRRLEVGEGAFIHEVAERNNRRATKVLKDVQDEKDAWAREDRRWLPALAKAHEPGRRWAYDSELKSEVVPLVSPGIDLKGS